MSTWKKCLNSTTVHTKFCQVSEDSAFFTTQLSVCVQIFLISLIIASCLLFNSLMFYAVYKTSTSSTSPSRQSVSSILLTNLAVVNILIGILVLPFWIISTGSLGWPLPYQLCELTAFLTTTLMQCSIFFLSGIAVDLYCCIRHPLRYPVLATDLKVGFVVSGIWVLCLFVASCPLYGWGKYRFQPQTIPICNPFYLEHISYSIFLIVIGMALPFSLMLFSYIKIVQIARDHIRRIDDSQRQVVFTCHEPSNVDNRDNNRNSIDVWTTETDRLSHRHEERHHVRSKFARNLKTVKRVLIAVVAFFLCWGPYVILNFWSVNNEDVVVPYSADLLTTLMAFANSTVNPVIFIILNKDYRRVMSRLATRLFKGCRRNEVVSLKEASPKISYIELNTKPVKEHVNNSFHCNSTCAKNLTITKTDDTTDKHSYLENVNDIKNRFNKKNGDPELHTEIIATAVNLKNSHTAIGCDSRCVCHNNECQSISVKDNLDNKTERTDVANYCDQTCRNCLKNSNQETPADVSSERVKTRANYKILHYDLQNVKMSRGKIMDRKFTDIFRRQVKKVSGLDKSTILFSSIHHPLVSSRTGETDSQMTLEDFVDSGFSENKYFGERPDEVSKEETRL